MVCCITPPGRTSMSWMVVLKPFGPHHCTTCFGSVQAAHTNSRGASNKREMTISRSLSVAVLFLTSLAVIFLLPCHLLQVVVEAVEAHFHATRHAGLERGI